MDFTKNAASVLVFLYFFCFSQCLEYGLRNENMVCHSEDCNTTARHILSAMDPSVDPCQDFYRFSCGRYLQTAVIPKDSDRVSTFTEAENALRSKIKSVVFQRIRASDPHPYKLLKTFMEICMDEDKMEAVGLEPALRRLEMAGGWPVLGRWRSSTWDLVTTLGTLDKVATEGADSLFGIGVYLDFKNTSRRIIQTADAKLGIDKNILIAGLNDGRVKAYYNHMVSVAVIFGANKRQAKKELKQSLIFEIELAKLIRPDEKKRNLDDSYHLFTLHQLKTQIGWLDWGRLLSMTMPPSILPLRDDEKIIVSDPEYLGKVGRLVSRYPKRTVSNYIMWRAAFSHSKYLTKELRNIKLKLDEKIYGITTRRPRWKECIQQADESLQHALASLYVKHFFDKDSKKKATELMNMIHDEIRRAVEENDWMDRKTRRRALEKVSMMHHHVGNPDELLDLAALDQLYKGVTLNRKEDFLSVVVKLNVFKNHLDMKLLREPVNKTDWRSHSNIIQVNAFYNPFENTVGIPAGILQNLFFGANLPTYVNLARIGLIMGHEITHGFDDQGSQTDSNGDLRNWWGNESLKRFKEKSQCMVNQFNGFKDNITNMTINGITTQGETVADQGSMKLVYQAWRRRGGGGLLLPGLQHFTREQTLMLSVANLWCEKRTLESRRRQILVDPHPPSDFRVKGIVMNFPHFREIFNCKRYDPMVSQHKCVVW